jgi:hypothetical protein
MHIRNILTRTTDKAVYDREHRCRRLVSSAHLVYGPNHRVGVAVAAQLRRQKDQAFVYETDEVDRGEWWSHVTHA